jgi:hypothetical protein
MGVSIVYKQRTEHIQKRIRRGAEHANWAGTDISEKGGRKRALRLYPPGPCVECAAPNGERHHEDGDTSNNEPHNVKMLCRRCHMQEDGRLAALKLAAAATIEKRLQAAASEKRARTECHRGHPLSGENLHVHGSKRICKACREINRQAYLLRKKNENC